MKKRKNNNKKKIIKGGPLVTVEHRAPTMTLSISHNRCSDSI